MLYFIPTPIGNLADISLRALSTLKECSVILCEDTRISKSLITLLNQRFDARINIDKFISVHSHNEAEFVSNLTPSFFDKNVAYLSDAGMPGISDPGAGLVKYALKNGIEFEVLAGANAALIALVSSGFCEKEFVFLGFLPNTGTQRKEALQNALNQPYPAIIYESPRRIVPLISNIAQIDPSREIFAIKEISKKFQNKFFGSAQTVLDKLENANIDGEWCVVLGANELAKNTERISIDDIKSLDIAPKQKAKLLSKLTGKSVKSVYAELTT
ncbi:16S rRNA (cytidine(1402)-2'-O)-methyltransferase [Campylobacter sp. 19-13652]|uniref:16S rRNA (cytidine(1402)-2'-O)-methyltransferase n=1 Tax=Campylobacter sp. 19-13652 TaxID=2840180 RepID=UPI001C75FD59|nr:16S rRNA (cytidine(1402)-2'-O)-methyltransferase [Campylobacter sp. 19-13652]BCX80116.1 ribosomal RNA small subunit methyltransferase I [Campylobacter sp. 19-13652]